MCDDDEAKEETAGVDRDNMRYLNTIYHGADGRISGELTPGDFLSADAERTADTIRV